MSSAHALVAVLLVVSMPVAAPFAQAPLQPKAYTIEQFLNTTSITGASFSPDESRLLFSANKTGIWNAYTIPIAGGAWTPVTSSTTDSTYAVSFFPMDDRILITRDQGGNELNHLYVRTPTGEERDVTPGENLKAIFMQWTPDGSAFYVQTNERDPKAFDIYRYDSKSYARVLKVESDEIVAGVKKNGVPVEYLVFPDEGHGFTKKKNQIAGYSAVLKFLDQHLKGRAQRSQP